MGGSTNDIRDEHVEYKILVICKKWLKAQMRKEKKISTQLEEEF